MYLLKNAAGAYYTRTCLPKSLKDKGFPFDIKISLLTKSRMLAIERNIFVLSSLRSKITQFDHNLGLETFQRMVDTLIHTTRNEFSGGNAEPVPEPKDKFQVTLLPKSRLSNLLTG